MTTFDHGNEYCVGILGVITIIGGRASPGSRNRLLNAWLNKLRSGRPFSVFRSREGKRGERDGAGIG